MAYEISAYSLKITLVAGGDLSSSQYKFVKINSSGQAVAIAAVTDRPIGVLQNAPTSGQEAEIVVVGGTKIKAGGTIDEGNVLGVDADGDAVSKTVGTDTTHYIAGTCILAAGNGEIGTAVINCASAGRAS